MTGFTNDISNTGGPGSSAEPSMEEILASIRRILKEDDRTAPARVDLDDDVLLLDASMVAKSPDLASGTELPPENDLAAAHPDAPVTSYHSEMHIASEPAPMTVDLAVEPLAPETVLFAPAESEFAPPPPEITISAPEPEPDPEPDSAAPAPAADESWSPSPPHDIHEEIVEESPATESVFTAPAEAPPESFMSQSYQPPDGLVGDEAAASAKNSIGALVRSISQERVVAVSRGGITIEDIVREEIRPMLKAWLDTNLPVLVERIVRAEIERVVDRTQL